MCSVDNKLLSKFSVDSEVLFASYACFTPFYWCIGHYAGNYDLKIINRQFNWLFCQTNVFSRTVGTQTLYLKASDDV